MKSTGLVSVLALFIAIAALVISADTQKELDGLKSAGKARYGLSSRPPEVGPLELLEGNICPGFKCPDPFGRPLDPTGVPYPLHGSEKTPESPTPPSCLWWCG